MPEKDLTNWQTATWLLAMGMAHGGGVVANAFAVHALHETRVSHVMRACLK